MSCKGRIVMVLVSLGLASAAASPVAFAGSPLLSGYGGPGAGEQAVIGATLIGGAGGGSGGGSGSGSSSGSGGSGSTSTDGGSGSTGSGTTSAVTGGSSAGKSSGGGAAGKGATSATRGNRGGSRTTGSTSVSDEASMGVQTRAFVYPIGLRSASTGSSAMGISGSDLLLFLAVIASLALVAVATLRLSRLQR